ncbi:hypothetical protein BD560DRAFT_234493 [Blakeslea trispora]|nr:hypothetical protein BD560DRAFT_234493 [Blakeslea trispora]
MIFFVVDQASFFLLSQLFVSWLLLVFFLSVFHPLFLLLLEFQPLTVSVFQSLVGELVAAGLLFQSLPEALGFDLQSLELSALCLFQELSEVLAVEPVQSSEGWLVAVLFHESSEALFVTGSFQELLGAELFHELSVVFVVGLFHGLSVDGFSFQPSEVASTKGSFHVSLVVLDALFSASLLLVFSEESQPIVDADLPHPSLTVAFQPLEIVVGLTGSAFNGAPHPPKLVSSFFSTESVSLAAGNFSVDQLSVAVLDVDQTLASTDFVIGGCCTSALNVSQSWTGALSILIVDSFTGSALLAVLASAKTVA